jgi:hypothetical protein
MDKAESNRKNAQFSTGPRNTESTRHNAVKHGLLAKGITELDDSDAYESLLQQLMRLYRPVGEVEDFLVHRIAFCMIRLRRAGRLEAEYITGEIHPAVKGVSLESLLEPAIEDPGLPPAVSALGAINLATGFQRYETAIENKLYRAINQLERLQLRRQGEFVPAPEAVDVSLHLDAEPKREQLGE